MPTSRRIAIAAWNESQYLVSDQHRRKFRVSPAIGVVGTLVLHALALQMLFISSRTHETQTMSEEPGSSQQRSDAQSTQSLIFIDLPKKTSADNGRERALGFAALAPNNAPSKVKLPDLAPLRDIRTDVSEDQEPAQGLENAGEASERARLQGIYTGQIQARIDRVWRRPRTPVYEGREQPKAGAPREYFQCQVQVVQDSIGNVQEVLVPECNGSASWQRSLLAAIRQASPLPAPPDPRVFSRTVTLNFVGYAYGLGAPEDLYEAAPIKTAQAAIAPSR